MGINLTFTDLSNDVAMQLLTFLEEIKDAPTSTRCTPDGVELDIDGLPWDRRIHSNTRAKIADGRWRAKRGVSPELVASVTAELKSTMSAPVPVDPPAPLVEQQVAFESMAPSTEIPSFVPPPPPPPAAPVLTFATLMPILTEAVTSGRITQVALFEAVQSLGLPNIGALSTRPDLVQAVATKLGVV